MGHITDAAVSGDGMLGPFTGNNVAYIYVDVTSTPLSNDVQSATTPPRVLRQGWVAIGVHVTSDCGGACPDGLRVRRPWFIDFTGAIINPPPEDNWGDSVLYHLEPDVTAHIYVEDPT